jgi:hypothetical protein
LGIDDNADSAAVFNRLLPGDDSLMDNEAASFLDAGPSCEALATGPSGFGKKSVHPVHSASWHCDLGYVEE